MKDHLAFNVRNDKHKIEQQCFSGIMFVTTFSTDFATEAMSARTVWKKLLIHAKKMKSKNNCLAD